jgi:hypothetical protein
MVIDKTYNVDNGRRWNDMANQFPDMKLALGNMPNMPMITNPQHEAIKQNLASEFCEKLYRQIIVFDSKLDNNKEVAIRLVSFGQSVTFSVTNLGYSNPSLIRFCGYSSEGSYVELIQHVSQISFLLTSAQRENPDQPKRPIGFECG